LLKANEKELLVAASVANIENCFIKSNVNINTASGWLQRLVRHFGVTAYWPVVWDE
jgi:hypothetical protein